jgi:NCAIR mutase (PurE)-related protein
MSESSHVREPTEPSPLVADLGHTRLDLDRTRRVGLPEAVFAAGKTPSQCVEIVERLLVDGDAPVIVTRCEDRHLDALSALSPQGTWTSTLTWRHAATHLAPVAVVSGGTSDQPVLDECVGTLTASGAEVRVVRDVGVAGLHRLLGSLDELAGVGAIVTIAGMEAALPTVLAGLVREPIVAVPTSVGYGTTFEGLTALLSTMSSCAPGVSVVGIDNGYGAACAALRIVGVRP